MSSTGQNVFFVGVARKDTSDGYVVASFAFNTETNLDAVKEVLVQPNLSLQPGKHYSFAVGTMGWHIIQDDIGLIYLAIVQANYPTRVAHALLEDLRVQFTSKVDGHKATTAKDRVFDRSCTAAFDKLCRKFDNLDEVDKLSALTKKVDTVKLTMQENIEVALQNCVKLESIEAQAEELQQQAGVFKKSAAELKNKMWWKNMKMWLIIGFIILAVIGIIIGIIVAETRSTSNSSHK